MQKVLIIGGKGNLGNQIAGLLPEALCWDRAELDITNQSDVKTKLTALSGIDCVINCAAFNDLDAAEDNPELAFALNETAPKTLAEVCKELDLTLIHFSTGYVFSGEDGVKEHDEQSVPDPNSVYAKSKLAGEEAIKQVASKFFIIRTNLLFGPRGQSELAKNSVVDVMRQIGAEKKHLRGITDEFSNFTYTPDLAQAVVNLLQDQPAYGLYHLTNEGFGSWYDLSKEIFLALGWDVVESSIEPLPEKTIVIEKITGSEYTRKAKRPSSAVILNTKLPKLRDWKSALKEYLNSPQS